MVIVELKHRDWAQAIDIVATFGAGQIYRTTLATVYGDTKKSREAHAEQIKRTFTGDVVGWEAILGI